MIDNIGKGVNFLGTALGWTAQQINESAAKIKEGRWTGGMTYAGNSYMTGELGPEFAIDRLGRMSLLGANGPQVFTPNSDTAIIPASATQNPFGGNYGDAPSWAKNMLQSSFTPQPAVVGGMPSIRFGDIYASNEIDIEQAVRRAYAKMLREQQERGYK